MVMTNKQIATKTPYDLQQENGQKKEKLCWRKLRSTLQIRSKQIKKQKDNTLLQKERAAQTNQITTLQSIKGETLIILQRRNGHTGLSTLVYAYSLSIIVVHTPKITKHPVTCINIRAK